MLLAVPSTIFIALSKSLAFKSGILRLAISSIFARDNFATFSLLGIPDPFSIPAASFNKKATGGFLQTKVKDLSSYTFKITGITVPTSCLVFSLKALQNSPI